MSLSTMSTVVHPPTEHVRPPGGSLAPGGWLEQLDKRPLPRIMTDRPLRQIGPRRGLAKLNFLKTHCIRGHEFDNENTGWQICARGYLHRFCRRCARDYRRGRRNQPEAAA